jgi:hypothetical protein
MQDYSIQEPSKPKSLPRRMMKKRMDEAPSGLGSMTAAVEGRIAGDLEPHAYHAIPLV